MTTELMGLGLDAAVAIPEFFWALHGDAPLSGVQFDHG